MHPATPWLFILGLVGATVFSIPESMPLLQGAALGLVIGVSFLVGEHYGAKDAVESHRRRT